MEQSMNELMEHTADMGQAEMFSKEWYNEYFRRAAESPTHARFCEAVYGRDLCQHGMMDIDEMGFLASLLKPGEKVLEVGCSNGFITEHIHRQAGCDILGVDYSDVAVGQAQARTRGKADRLNFQCVDLIQDELPGGEYDVILAIDSIYFMGDYNQTLAKLNAKLAPGGRMIIAAFQVKEEGDPETILLPGHTRMDEALKDLSFRYTRHDFTENVRNHWIKNYECSRKLQSDFAAEGNAFLCEARMAENGWFKDHAERETLVRFLYVIDHNGALA
ncbi:class I SAM-dependent methyltransferase [Methylohalobius crimeensis]|uniref:class I SAM-dependent methyltransferase n=1 Tax=Methylohalobius crimeensis TaxID=244365 RepID=UPI0003B4EE32|nr:class I SAM-dependent methyltransferase [Methylohalobius crimeensis]